jgi:hypothetical protein
MMGQTLRYSSMSAITRPGKATALHQLSVVQINKPDCETMIINGGLRSLAVTLAVRRNPADHLCAAKIRGTEMTNKTGIASGFCLLEIKTIPGCTVEHVYRFPCNKDICQPILVRR